MITLNCGGTTGSTESTKKSGSPGAASVGTPVVIRLRAWATRWRWAWHVLRTGVLTSSDDCRPTSPRWLRRAPPTF